MDLSDISTKRVAKKEKKKKKEKEELLKQETNYVLCACSWRRVSLITKISSNETDLKTGKDKGDRTDVDKLLRTTD